MGKSRILLSATQRYLEILSDSKRSDRSFFANSTSQLLQAFAAIEVLGVLKILEYIEDVEVLENIEILEVLKVLELIQAPRLNSGEFRCFQRFKLFNFTEHFWDELGMFQGN